MPKKGKKQATPKAKPLADKPACVICMNVPPAGEGEHHCSTCTVGAWVVCAGCEKAIQGKQCPICRGDYMREAASGWDALPADTTEVLELDEQPTQDELKRISARFPRLKQLTISPEYEDEPVQLDFAADGVHFSALTRLNLSCVGLQSITFTEANTPLLEHLDLSNVQGDCCPFHLALPQLRVLNAEHTMLGERSIDVGQFGLSLTRCPRLKTLHSYKFRCLGECNYAVLPSLRSLRLHRSECTGHLDILYAPALREVSLQAAYDLRGFRLRNLPTASLATVEALLGRKAAAEDAAREVARAEDRRWRDQTNVKALTKEARRRGWLDRGEKWQVAAEPPGEEEDECEEDYAFEACEEVLQEHVQELFDQALEEAGGGAAEAELLGASVADASLPRVTIDTTNMDGFRLNALEPQVRGRCKVRKERDFWGGGGGGGGYSDDDDEEEEEEEGDDEGDDDDGMAGDPRENFMRMMMGTGMPQMAGMHGMEEEDEEDEEEDDDEDEDGIDGMEGDPRETFMQMMMATGMPQMAGMRMIPGRMGSGGPPRDVLQALTGGLPPGVRVNVPGGHSFTTGGGRSAAPAAASDAIPLRPGEAQDPRRLLERVMHEHHAERRAAAPAVEEEPAAQPRRTRSQGARPKRGRNAGRSSLEAAYDY